jgi:uncharacterized membrane protein
LPVLWEKGKAQPLPTVDGDPDGFAFWINGKGQAVGQSNNCSFSSVHAVSWENGAASALPDFGNGAVAQGINDRAKLLGRSEVLMAQPNMARFGRATTSPASAFCREILAA